MMRFRLFLVVVMLNLNFVCFGQWSDDFSGDLSAWQGDVDIFRINENNQLQLNAPDAGNGYIYRSSMIDTDTVSIGLYHMLDFAPSDNNSSTIYLALDNEDPLSANGYAIRIGENGSDDAIRFIYLNNGVEETVASGTMGAVSNDPVEILLQADVTLGGLWTISVNYEGQPLLTPDLEFVDDRFQLNQSTFFGIECNFSSSRKDRFFYDDLFVKKFERDLDPPQVVSTTVIGSNKLNVLFSEAMDISSTQNLTNYLVDNGIGNPISISTLNAFMTEFELVFNSDFGSIEEYTLTINNVEDANGNIIGAFNFSFRKPGEAIAGELIFTEILFDPYPDGSDFIELYNTSTRFLTIKDLILRNEQRDESKLITLEYTIGPNEYLALTEDASQLLQEYKPITEANIVEVDLPSFNNDTGNAKLINPDGITLDSFDYDEEQHFVLIDDTEGVSLERLDLTSPSTNRDNWRSAAENVRFATPGYENSNRTNGFGPSTGRFTMSTPSFSPNQDGDNDLMILNYNLEKSGFVANLAIHNSAGFKIRDLNSNTLLSQEGSIIWDGTDNDGNIPRLGIYLVVGELFHPDGDILHVKESVVLADFID